MKFNKTILIVLIAVSLSFTQLHKYYFSVTDVEYVEEKQSLQIITRMFIDDFEKVLQQRYDEDILLNETQNSDKYDNYINKYLTQKIVITINDKEVNLTYLGKKYEDDLIICYLEIENIKSVEHFKIANTVLFEMFEDQQNMIKTKINSINKNLLLIKENPKGAINY